MNPISKELRRYLIRMDTRQLGHLFTDCLVIGAGVAGLRAALCAAEVGSVRVLCKGKVTESNTYYAQGGIASTQPPPDSFDAHIADTLATGCGLCREDTVDFVIRHGPEEMARLEEWEMPFDRGQDGVAVGREGGHSQSRVLHANGDATGEALAETLLQQVRQHESVKVFEDCFAIDLLTDGNRCLGVVCYHPRHGLQCLWARRTILAAGGAGQLWRETTNPAGATADGIAMAFRAGAVVSDLEFMQFHPTTLYIAGAARTLITEAIRGEGALIRDRQGHRFMPDYHDSAELAPRDVVSRAIYEHMRQSGTTHVYLDVRHLGSEWLSKRFPRIHELCQAFDIDADNDMIPVRPSAHYMVGGVKTDAHGHSSIENLYCCGESAASGLHGANRLASNSLLEGLVLGDYVGREVAEAIRQEQGEVSHCRVTFDIPESQRTRLDIPDVFNSLRAVMWRNVGIIRHGDRLAETIEIIDFWRRYVMDKVLDDPKGWECQNMLTVARLVAMHALGRGESRGVHFRSDAPAPDEAFLYHIDTHRDDTVGGH